MLEVQTRLSALPHPTSFLHIPSLKTSSSPPDTSSDHSFTILVPFQTSAFVTSSQPGLMPSSVSSPVPFSGIGSQTSYVNHFFQTSPQLQKSTDLVAFLSNLKLSVLKKKVKDFGIRASGNKQKLVEALINHMNCSLKDADYWLTELTNIPELLNSLTMPQLRTKMTELGLEIGQKNKPKLIDAILQHIESSPNKTDSVYWMNLLTPSPESPVRGGSTARFQQQQKENQEKLDQQFQDLIEPVDVAVASIVRDIVNKILNSIEQKVQ
jgi:hypothetical protein